MMIPALNRKNFARAVGVALGVALTIGWANSAARAFDLNEEDMPDVKIFRGLMKSLGMQKDSGIDYRERSPLVVPPNRDLPPPVRGSTLEKNPAWPVDPEVKERRAARAESTKPSKMVDEANERSRPLRPNEFQTNGAAPGKGPGDNRVIDYSAPMKPNELGYKGGLFSSILSAKEEEYGTFVGEAPRTSLIEPPPGYRTPSPTQPYGLGKQKYNPTPIDRLLPVR